MHFRQRRVLNQFFFIVQPEVYPTLCGYYRHAPGVLLLLFVHTLCKIQLPSASSTRSLTSGCAHAFTLSVFFHNQHTLSDLRCSLPSYTRFTTYGFPSQTTHALKPTVFLRRQHTLSVLRCSLRLHTRFGERGVLCRQTHASLRTVFLLDRHTLGSIQFSFPTHASRSAVFLHYQHTLLDTRFP